MSGKTFGARLKELREQTGLTQTQLAERAGMHQFGVAKIEQGLREPTWATVQALAKALGVNCLAFEGTVSAKETAEPPEPRKPGRPRKAPAEPVDAASPAPAPVGQSPQGKRPRGKAAGKAKVVEVEGEEAQPSEQKPAAKRRKKRKEG